jgi:hypothetical protein
VGGGSLVELILHHPGLHQRGPAHRVELYDPVQVPGQVEHHAGSYRLAGQARSRAPGHDRHAELTGCLHRRRDVVGVTREHNTQRSYRVHAGVAGENVATVVVEGDLAVHRRAERPLKARDDA